MYLILKIFIISNFAFVYVKLNPEELCEEICSGFALFKNNTDVKLFVSKSTV